MRSDRWTPALTLGLLTVQILLLGVLVYRINGLEALVRQLTGGASNPATPTFETVDVEPGDGPFKGAQEAPVTIVEFSCFTCPSCADLQPTLRQALEEHAGEVRLAFRYFPLKPQGKPLLLAKGAECAHRQGRFWEAHDRLFARALAIATEADLVAELADVGLDATAFADCLASEEVAERVKADFEAGLGYGVRYTPTLFVNGRRLPDMNPRTLDRAIRDSLEGDEA